VSVGLHDGDNFPVIFIHLIFDLRCLDTKPGDMLYKEAVNF